MKEFEVKAIGLNSFFSETVYLDNAFVIAAPEMPFSKDIANTLEKWNFKSVFSGGEPRKEYMNTQTKSDGASHVISDISMQSDSDKLEKASAFYSGLLSFTENLFVRANISDELEYKVVLEKIRDIVEYVKEDRRFLMRVLRNVEPAPDKNYLATHSVRSTILAIVIGSYLKLPNHRLIELGIAALLHEAGMLKLPSHIYLSNRPLTPGEQKAIVTHPILSYTMLKSLTIAFYSPKVRGRLLR